VIGLQLCAPAFATEDLVSAEYANLVVDDVRHVLSEPVRWDRRDWLLAGIGTGAVVATGFFVDEPLREEIQRHRNKANDRLAHFFRPLGYEDTFILLGAFEAGGMLFHDDRALETAHDGLAASLIATGLITGSLKLGLGRSRPFDQDEAGHFRPFGGDDSFPSGHTTQSFAVATVLSEHYDIWWVKVLSYGAAAMVGWSRMENDSHWASDVLAGGLIGIAVGKTVVAFNREHRYRLSPVADGDTVGIRATRTF
jgi:membrane-associated phospholipid phosphatase